MLNAPQIEFRSLFDRIGDYIRFAKNLTLWKKNKKELIRMLYQQLELISV